jgi:predicted dienelactone hydrolase
MLTLLALTLAVAFATTQVCADEPLKSQEGPLAIETADRLTLHDAARKKDLICKVHFPKTGGPHPVILFSHGFGGNKDAFGPVGRHWASHGYVVVHPTHADGLGRTKGIPTADTGEEAGPRMRFQGLLAGINDPQKIGDRMADLVLILDSLDHLPNSVPALKGKIDAKHVGVAGHSFGAYTAMLIGGVTADLGNEKGKGFADKRVACILPISGQGTGQQGLTNRSWDLLTLPMMTITGTRDQGASGQGVDWKKQPYRFSPKGDKFLVVIDGANHLSFGGGLGARGSAPTEVVKLCSTHYWDAYLKDSAAAKKYLQSDQLVRDSGGKCAFERK